VSQEAQDIDSKFDDEDYPAYSMGRAAEMLGTTPGFLRSLDKTKVITPLRSSGGHRRYSRYQLRIAARVRELVHERLRDARGGHAEPDLGFLLQRG
jgi:hypothetical protein